MVRAPEALSDACIASTITTGITTVLLLLSSIVNWLHNHHHAHALEVTDSKL